MTAGLLSLHPTTVSGQAAEEGPAGEGPAGDGRSGWTTVALGTALLGFAFILDDPARDLAMNVQGAAGDDLAQVADDYGAWKTTAPILVGGGLLVGLGLEGGDGARRVMAATLGVISGSLVHEGINRALGRRRPREDMGAWQFDPFHGHASLGSGHAAYAFAIAGAVDEVTEGWVATPFYAVAAGVGVARVYGDRHWLSDVVVGGFIGLWVSRRATREVADLLGVGGAGRQASESASHGPRVIVTGRFVGLELRH